MSSLGPAANFHLGRLVLTGVRRKATILGIVALLLSVGAGTLPRTEQVLSSVRNIQRNFGDLQRAESMNAVERLVFSLVLAHSKAPAETANEAPSVGGRS